jgi:hypothetical protein
MSETLTMASLMRAMEVIDAMPKPVLMTIVQYRYAQKGKAWQMMDDGHLYAFIHPDDLAAIPTAAASQLGVAGVPVRSFDEDMRRVFIRGLARMAAASGEDVLIEPRSFPYTFG